MSRQCCVVSCTTRTPVPPHVTMYPVPKSEELLEKWKDFILKAGCRWKSRKWGYFLVCSNHFDANCFQNLTMFQMGFASKLLLKQGAVPSVVKPDKQIVPRKVTSSNQVSEAKQSNSIPIKHGITANNIKRKELHQNFFKARLQPTKTVKEIEITSKLPNVIPINKLMVVPSRTYRLISGKGTAYDAEDILRFFRTSLFPEVKENDNRNQDKFKMFKKEFVYTDNGDLYHLSKDGKMDFKIVISSDARKDLILSHYHSLNKKWRVKELGKVISQYFYWPQFERDFVDWKKQNHQPLSEHCSVDGEDTQSEENEESESSEDNNISQFLAKVQLTPNEKSKMGSLPLKEHDYIADKLTLKRMICSCDPSEERPAKMARKTCEKKYLPVQNKRDRLLSSSQLSKIMRGDSPHPVFPEAARSIRVPILSDRAPPRPDCPPVRLTQDPEIFNLIPDAEDGDFLSLLGIEEIVGRLNGESPGGSDPYQCTRCGKDVSARWHRRAEGIVCGQCVDKETRTKRLETNSKLIARRLHIESLRYLNRPKRTSSNLGHSHKVASEAPTRIVVKRVASSQSSSSSKMSLMEAANRIRDHINSKLAMLQKTNPCHLKKPPSVAIRVCQGSRPGNHVIMHRTKPPSSEELIRCMRQSQRGKKV